MGDSKPIGRIGGLAVALGVGMAVATMPGVAWADDTGSANAGGTTGTAGAAGTGGPSEPEGTSNSTGATTGGTGTSTDGGPQPGGAFEPGSGAVDAATSSTSASTDASVRQVPPGMVLTTGRAGSSKKSNSKTPANGDVAAKSTLDDSTPPKRAADSTAKEPEAPVTAKAPVTNRRGGPDKRQRTVTAAAGATPSRPQPSRLAGTVVDVAVDQPAAPQDVTAAGTFSAPQTGVVARQAISAAPEAPPEVTVSGVVLGVLGLASSATDGPRPVDSPLELALAAVGTRRQFGQPEAEKTRSIPVSSTPTGQATDGLVTGDLTAADGQGDPQALAGTSTTRLSAPVTVDAASATAPSASGQVKTATPQTQQSGRGRPVGDTTAPTVSLTGPAAGAFVSGTVTLRATASDNVKVEGVQFFVDGTAQGAEVPTKPPNTVYAVSWNTTQAANGSHTLTAVARDAAGNRASTSVNVTVDNAAPTVSVTAPAAGTVSGTETLDATASDNGGAGVAGVQFSVDGKAQGAEDTTAPYSVSWNTTQAANGTHILTAVARDAVGNKATSSQVTVTVDNTAPTVSVTAPAAGAPVSGTVTLRATASDNVGVTGVQFLLEDGTKLGEEVPSSPYNVSWDTTTVANGTQTVTAVARDAAGNTTTSAAVSVTVNNPDIQAPTVSVTAPAAGATVFRGTVTVSAAASDNVGVVGVQFKLDGNPLGPEDTTPESWGVSWDTTTVADGTHQLSAVARDAAGNITDSAVSVTVADTAPPQIPVITTSIAVGSSPVEVALSGNYAYVLNQASGNLTVIDTTTKEVVGGPISVGYDSTSVVAHGQTVYVDSMTYVETPDPEDYNVVNTVLVIDATTNEVVDTITLDPWYWWTQYDLAISPDGSRLYLGTMNGYMTAIDTASRSAIDPPIWTTSWDSDIKVSSDGSLVYLTDPRGDGVAVYRADPLAWIDGIHVGPNQVDEPRYVTVGPAGSNRIYSSVRIVEPASGPTEGVDSYYAVSVIDVDPQSDTYNSEIALIRLDGGARDLEISPDGTRLYVDQGDGKTVIVIDTITNTVVGSFTTDQSSTAGVRSIAVSPDGNTLFITDAADNMVYLVNVGPPELAT